MKKKTRINYDQSGDVLYIIFGDSRPSYAEELGDGVYARYDMENDELNGITILDFSKRSKDEIVKMIITEGVLSNAEATEILH